MIQTAGVCFLAFALLVLAVADTCPEEGKWDETAPGNNATVACPTDSTIQITRYCTLSGNWSYPDISECPPATCVVGGTLNNRSWPKASHTCGSEDVSGQIWNAVGEIFFGDREVRVPKCTSTDGKGCFCGFATTGGQAIDGKINGALSVCMQQSIDGVNFNGTTMETLDPYYIKWCFDWDNCNEAVWTELDASNGCRCDENDRTSGSNTASLAECKDKCISKGCIQIDYKPVTGWCNTYNERCALDHNCSHGWTGYLLEETQQEPSTTCGDSFDCSGEVFNTDRMPPETVGSTVEDCCMEPDSAAAFCLSVSTATLLIAAVIA